MDRLIELNDEQVVLELKKILESWPLYRELRWTGSRHSKLPDSINLFCTQCTKDQTWRFENRGSPHDLGMQLRQFRCTNCKDQMTTFAYCWVEEKQPQDRGGALYRRFVKIGQSPALEERIEPELEKALKTGQDLSLYKTALRLRNFNSGIGAMAYMRRIIENHMNDMLEILSKDADSDSRLNELWKARFDEKLAAAAELFPKHLIPEGAPNPFKPLYQLTSEAIHNLSEGDSVELFDECRLVFEYVFSQLRPHMKREQDFRTGLQRLAKTASEREKR